MSYCCLIVDITVYHGGFHGDLNETMFVGTVSENSRKLVNTAYECMMEAIKTGQPLCVRVHVCVCVCVRACVITFFII